MIELAFNEGAAGALKASEVERSGEVVPLTLALDIGDISDLDTDVGSRKKALDELFGDFPGVPEEIWQTNKHSLARLRKAKETQESVRMWVCASNPAELCGLFFVCHLMANARTPLSIVRIPEEIEKENSIISYRNSGEIGPEELSAYTEYEIPISNLKRTVYSNKWVELMRENAPLRAVVNGSLIGVPIDFYDFVLRTNIQEGETMVAYLIGKTLGPMPGVSDRWLFLRIQSMIRSGELISISEAKQDNPYSGVVKHV